MSPVKLSLLLPFVLIGCEEAPTVEPTFDSISSEIFEKSCIDSGCHGATTGAGNLFLDGDRAYDSLMSTPCDNPIAIAEGLERVAPGDSAASFLYMKVVDPVGMGVIMPPNYNLTEDELAAIAEWIDAGAVR